MERKQFRCGQCGKKVNTVDAERVTVRRCTTCAPDLAKLPAKRSKPAKGARKAVAVATAPKASRPARKRQGVVNPAAVGAGEAIASVAEPADAEASEEVPPAVGPKTVAEPMVAGKPVAPATTSVSALPCTFGLWFVDPEPPSSTEEAGVAAKVQAPLPFRFPCRGGRGWYPCGRTPRPLF